MNHINVPVGTSHFAEIRKENYYYVDKTGLIEELVNTPGIKATLITRPRRFGKSLGMSMLSEFFDIRKDNPSLFAGLSISKNKELCDKWMNQYPTIFISLKSVDGLNFSVAYARLAAEISNLYKEHLYLSESETVNIYDKKLFHRIASKMASVEEISNSLLNLTRLLSLYYNKPVILLIDEYDVPLAKASANGYYDEMLDVIKGIMQTIKDNIYLQFAVITGCLRIAKESIFTGTNNFVSDTISDTRLNEYFGFTQTEVDQLLQTTNLTSHSSEIKSWYDGYHFGKFDIYCPWDVMNHVNALLLNPSSPPKGYWMNSSDNAIIRSFIDYTGNTITKKFETLLAGDYVIQAVKEELTYDYLHSSEENLWTILYLTGYLTKVRDEKIEGAFPQKDELALMIPNLEIREIFEKTIIQWFSDSARKWNRQQLFGSIWSGDAESATIEMTKVLRKTISYHDYKEDFYHAFFAGIFAGADYVVESNKEHGEGRSDIVVEDYAGDRIAVFEVKYSNTAAELSKDCDKAIEQINQQAFAEAFKDEYSQVICYGIAFYKKRCLIRIKKIKKCPRND